MTRSDGFRKFISNLATNIEKHEEGQIEGESRLERQYRQLKLLIRLEKEFRRTLIRHSRGPATYKKFVQHILHGKRNILAARPYFRERQQVFSREISSALKKAAHKGLFRFDFNYTFVAFVMKSWDWAPKSPITKLARQIEAIRQEITEMNMPLALSQTRAFWENTPRSHLSYMDLVQIHALGLLVAVDKFVPPNTKGMTREEELQAYRSFRAVAIGRMMGDRIESYSETVIHYYPSDKRKLYRAHKALRITGTENIDFDKLSDTVNDGLDEPSKTNPDEMAELLASAALMSGDVVLEPDGETLLERHPSSMVTAEDRLEEADALAKMRFAIRTKLSEIERKVLRLKGIQL